MDIRIQMKIDECGIEVCFPLNEDELDQGAKCGCKTLFFDDAENAVNLINALIENFQEQLAEEEGA